MTAILICLAVLAAAGVRAATGSARTAIRWQDTVSVVRRVVRTLVTTTVLITGVQWAIVATVHDWRVLLVVLGAPALLAAGTVARVAAATQTTTREGALR